MLYAIVDIETTGGHASGNGITEIAIVIHDGKNILDFYETLINPKQKIPRFIEGLTGITDAMVEHAPVFEEVAAQVHELLQDKVFIAHNVNFDYSFVKYHLQNSGYDLDERKLCTVRLSRKIIPGLRSYSLGKLCHSLGITNGNRHRAGGDAMATAELFTMLVDQDKEGVIEAMLKGRNREQYLPPNVPVEQLDRLPTMPGVYYFYNAAGKIIYIGKAKNLLKRVKSHFSNNKAGKQKQDFMREVHNINFKECATDLMAHILESTEIRKLWPVHNRSQRGYLTKFGLHIYEDRNGFKRLIVERNKNVLPPIYTFNTLIEGHNQLRELITEFELCTRLCHLARIEENNGADCAVCSGKITAEDYNKRVDEAVEWMNKHLPSFALVDKGRTIEEQSCILIQRGNLYGMGYIKHQTSFDNIDVLQEQLEPLQDNDYIRNLVYKHAANYPDKCVVVS